MKTTTLILIIAGIVGIIAVIGLILVLKSEKPDTGNWILKKSGYVLFVILILTFLYSDLHRDYTLHEEQKMWEKFNLPQIDSNMRLTFIRPRWSFYSAIRKDSIYHSSKSIKFDLFDVYSIEDGFINKHQDKLLTVRFIKPNILRDSSRVITIKTHSDYSNKLPIDTLTIEQFDSILVDWGLFDITYEKVLQYTD